MSELDEFVSKAHVAVLATVDGKGRAQAGPKLADGQRLELATRYLGEELGRRYTDATAANDSVSIRLRPRKTIVFEGRAGRAIR